MSRQVITRLSEARRIRQFTAGVAFALIVAAGLSLPTSTVTAQGRFIATYSFRQLQTTPDGVMVMLIVDLRNESDANALSALLQVVDPQNATKAYGEFRRGDLHRRRSQRLATQFIVPAAEVERWSDGGHPAFVLYFNADNGQSSSAAPDARRTDGDAP